MESDLELDGEAIQSAIRPGTTIQYAVCAADKRVYRLYRKALDRWAYENGVTLDFSRPGKPTGNRTCRLA